LLVNAFRGNIEVPKRTAMEFTGERFVPGLGGEIKHTHVHRYALAQEFVEGKCVLDIASGEGYGAALLANTAKSVIGVDIDPKAIEHAQHSYAAQLNLEFRVGSCDKVPLPDKSVDVVTSFETIEHVDKQVEMMREVKRVLLPGGILVISSPNRPLYSERFNLVNPFHVKELDHDELVNLLEDHFRFVQLYGQKLAAGSFVFPLSDSSNEGFAIYADNGGKISRKSPSLKYPEFFVALCSDAEIRDPETLESIYIDIEEELLQTTHDELSWMRANYMKDVALLEDIKSSLGFNLVSRLIWPLSRRLVPQRLRAPIKAALIRLKQRLSSPAASQPSNVRNELPWFAFQTAGLDASSAVDFIPQKIAPLRLQVAENVQRRVNVLISIVNLQYFFAGCMCMFNLALQLKRNGYHVRLVIVDSCDYNPSRWKREIAEYDGLRSFFDEVETAYVFNRANSLDASPTDVFLATSWWTAHIAHHATRQLRQENFVYLIQEYEPMFHPGGSFYALAEQAYTFPHHAIFSTEVLRDYFQQNRVGVFAPGSNGRLDANPVVIRNAVNSFKVTEEDLRSRQRRRLLFYARPEQNYNARNVFELGVLAIRETLRDGHFDLIKWDFHGIGAMSKYRSVPLHHRAELKMLPGVSLPEFVKLLPTYDLGLSLMLTPHPSLMPLDMAAAGLVTVTNTFATKTSEKMSEISQNIIAVPATLEGLKTGLIAALADVNNFEKRVAGSRLNWSMSWDETFGESVMTQIKEYLA